MRGARAVQAAGRPAELGQVVDRSAAAQSQSSLHGTSFPADQACSYGRVSKLVAPVLYTLAPARLPPVNERPADVLRKTAPGRMFRLVKLASWIELGLFGALLVVWLVPGLERETFYAGLAHGIGYIALAALIWVTVLRREAPYTLLAATLTPVGPVGSVIAIAYLERREPA